MGNFPKKIRMNKIKKSDIEALHTLLNNTKSPEPQEGDYSEIDENNIIHFFHKDGTPIMFMHIFDYARIIDQAIWEPLDATVDEINQQYLKELEDKKAK